jgi:hypothetical protein
VQYAPGLYKVQVDTAMAMQMWRAKVDMIPVVTNVHRRHDGLGIGNCSSSQSRKTGHIYF